MKGKLVIVGIICLVAGLGGGTLIGNMLLMPTLNEERDYSAWLEYQNYILSDNYDDLSDNYDTLLGQYNDLSDGYDVLQDGYDNLHDSYDNLLSNYNDLFSDYNILKNAFENPLTNPVVPTIGEVATWLSTDNTDLRDYTAYWMCGDFAGMLMTRAKTMNWRMRIAVMFYSFEGGFGWKNPTDPYGEFGHAFNMIYCQDGNDPDDLLDLYYIEPQTDTIWYIHYGSFNHLSYEIWITWTGGISGTVWANPYYINHYSYFA